MRARAPGTACAACAGRGPRGDSPLWASPWFGERALGRAASSDFRIGLLAGPHDPG